MKIKNSKALAFFLFMVIATSCSTKRVASLSNDSDIVRLSISQIDSATNLLLRITNGNKDTVIFPVKYLQKTFDIRGHGIVQKRSVVTKSSIPQSNFEELKKSDRTKVVNNLCRPYSLNDGFWIMGPGESNAITILLTDLGYECFRPDSDLHITCTLFASPALKKYCPSIWVGTLQDSAVLKIGRQFP